MKFCLHFNPWAVRCERFGCYFFSYSIQLSIVCSENRYLPQNTNRIEECWSKTQFTGKWHKNRSEITITLLWSWHIQHYLEMFHQQASIRYFMNCGSPLSQSPGPSEHSDCFQTPMWRRKWLNAVSIADKRKEYSTQLPTFYLLLSLGSCFHSVPISI